MLVAARVRSFIAAEQLLTGAETLLVAVSGGADSVCLLHLLSRLCVELGLPCKAAHFNHQLRGEEAARDEAFTGSLCRALGVPLLTGRGDVRAHARAHKQGLEEAARELRYAFLEECAAALPHCRVATAHQADDNAETMLLNLSRGAGLRGLCGIPPRRGRYIRPLLPVTRAEVEAYLAEHGLAHVEDSTNRDLHMARNRLRHTVIPVLRELNPRFTEAAAAAAGLLRRDEAFLSAEAKRCVSVEQGGSVLSATALCAMAEPLAARAVLFAAEAQGVRLDRAHVGRVQRLAEGADGRLTLPAGLTAEKRGDALLFARLPTSAAARPYPETELVYGRWTDAWAPDYAIYWGDEAESKKIHGNFTIYRFKNDNLCGKIIVRPRKAGDYLRLSGRKVGKTIKKWMIDEKIPRERRDRLPVLADEAGVLAVYGLGADARADAGNTAGASVVLIRERERDGGELFV